MISAVSATEFEMWLEVQQARAALRNRDDAVNRTRLEAAIADWDRTFDARHDCE